MKILYIIDSLVSGGKERQIIELLKGILTENKINIQLVILSDHIHYDYINNLNIEIHIIKRRHKKDLAVFLKIYKICKEFKPDIIHSWDAMCSVYSIPIAKLLRIKFINGIIRNSPLKFVFYKSKWWFGIKLTSFLSDMNFANSYSGLRSYNAKKNCYVVYNGFDLNRVKNIKNKEYIKKEYNIVTENIVGMVARFHKSKDYDSYIQAAINILDKRNDVTFLNIGIGDTLKRCVDLVPTRYKKYIRFLGEQKDVESIINILDIGVLSSYEDGISNAIMEYMAFEKPVVATKLGGNEEIVQNNITGFLVKPNDIYDLTEKIEYLLNNKDIACHMGGAGKERLEKEFSLQKMTDAHIKLYKKCLSN